MLLPLLHFFFFRLHSLFFRPLTGRGSPWQVRSSARGVHCCRRSGIGALRGGVAGGNGMDSSSPPLLFGMTYSPRPFPPRCVLYFPPYIFLLHILLPAPHPPPSHSFPFCLASLSPPLCSLVCSSYPILTYLGVFLLPLRPFTLWFIYR